MNDFGRKRKSAETVLEAFSETHNLTQEEIAGSTGLSMRSVKYAVKQLISCNAICENKDFSDMRRKSYRLLGDRHG